MLTLCLREVSDVLSQLTSTNCIRSLTKYVLCVLVYKCILLLGSAGVKKPDKNCQ